MATTSLPAREHRHSCTTPSGQLTCQRLCIVRVRRQRLIRCSRRLAKLQRLRAGSRARLRRVGARGASSALPFQRGMVGHRMGSFLVVCRAPPASGVRVPGSGGGAGQNWVEADSSCLEGLVERL
jgi:anti-sigma factor RsiW